MSRLLSKGWFKALVLALPATILFGPVAMIGAIMGIVGIYFVLIGEGLPSETFLNNYQWHYVFRGLGGVLGLVGLWLVFLFENRIKEKLGIFNWIVAGCLCCGVISGVLLLYDEIYIWEESQRLGYINITDYLYNLAIIMLVLVGIYYAVYCMKPNKRLQFDAAKPRD
jgi:hypothetical protein